MRNLLATRVLSGLSLCVAAALAGCPAQGDGDAGGLEDAGQVGDVGLLRDAGTCLTNADCLDELYCTDRERCVDGRCTFQPTLCDDGIDCTTDTCSETRRRCENVGPDADGDGARDADCYDYRGVALGDDCDDNDPMRSPSNLEICDAMGRDEDCDLTTFGGLDADGDDYESSACCQRDATGRLRCGGDCDDSVGSTRPLAGEICNGIDDDCDDLVDDIIHGSVLCARGESRPCTTTCGVPGTESCDGACLGWDSCVAAEVCNGCDDDNDSAQDEDFECGLGTSRACTTSCGTPGTQLCGSTCSYAACSGSEACNYCDDDQDGNFFEERPLATVLATDTWESCETARGDARCISFEPPSTVLTYGVLLDGTANNQAGAIWLDTGATMGWGPVELAVTMELEGRSLGGMDEMPLGGWGIVIGRGEIGAGTPRNNGIPTTITGVAAQWFWSQIDSCSGRPPLSGDGIRGTQLIGGGLRPLRTTTDMTTDSGCFSGYGLVGGEGGGGLDNPTQTITQQMRIRYTPDDPTTVPNEESMTITARAASETTNLVVPSDAIPVGTGPIRVGITAGTYTERFASVPFETGMPVQARVLVQRVDISCCRPATVTHPIAVTYTGTCPR